MIHSLYVDTSALAKAYLNEQASERFRAFFRQQAMPPAISTLTILELRCLLGRRCRAGDIGRNEEQLVVAALEQQIQVGLLTVCALKTPRRAPPSICWRSCEHTRSERSMHSTSRLPAS